jgi:hypothetical protein
MSKIALKILIHLGVLSFDIKKVAVPRLQFINNWEQDKSMEKE